MSVRLGGPLDETEGRRRGELGLLPSSNPPTRARRALPRSPQGGGGVGTTCASGCASTSPAISATAIPAPRTRPQIADWPSSAGGGWSGGTGGSNGLEGRPSSYRAEAEGRLEEELGLIRKLRLSGFFLLHHDMLELAREVAAASPAARTRRGDCSRQGTAGAQASGSLVCYLTGLSHIDPVENDLFLGRFLGGLTARRTSTSISPGHPHREDPAGARALRAGALGAGAAFATYRARGAVRDLGKALGLPPGEVERLARAVDVYEASRDAAEPDGRGAGAAAGALPALAGAELLPEIAGLPASPASRWDGDLDRELIELCPVQPAAMEGRQMVQWDKDSCADAGFMKIDLLGLGMLSAVERCVDEIARARRGERIDLSRVPLDDGEVWGAIQRGGDDRRLPDREPGADANLPRTLPQDLDDLTVQVALVRPGPIQGSVHPYIERRKRLREGLV